ncbi:MAG: hypothetical protein V9G19_23475 [Tetrasphaera sp.]
MCGNTLVNARDWDSCVCAADGLHPRASASCGVIPRLAARGESPRACASAVWVSANATLTRAWAAARAALRRSHTLNTSIRSPCPASWARPSTSANASVIAVSQAT